MPTYQYRCTECGNELEAVQKFSDPALTDCPACDGRLRKVFNAVGVVFKGSGFYRTDSRSDSKSGAGSTSDNGSASTEKKTADAGSSGDKTSSGTEKKPDGASTKQPAAAGTASSSSSSSGSGSSTAA